MTIEARFDGRNHFQIIMLIERHWDKLDDEKWDRMARGWLKCVRDGDDAHHECDQWWEIIVNFGLFGPPELLWKFIKRSLLIAESEAKFGSIAAGPIEYLLGRAGEHFIGAVEAEVPENSKLKEAIKLVNQYRMSDDVWQRVQKIQKT